MEQTVTFFNSRGNRLAGILSNPSGDKFKPIIIICHGFASNKNRPNFINLSLALNQHRISTFRFDFYGHGDSDGKFEDITVTEAVDDILQAINYLKKLGHKKIGLCGSSFGGLASLIAASKSPDLFALTLKSPVSDFEELFSLGKTKEEINLWKKRGYDYYQNSDGNKLKLNYTFHEDIKDNTAYQIASKIQVPTLITHGDHDETVPIKQSIKTAKLIKNCTLKVINGANHRYTNPTHASEMLKAISGFIDKLATSR